MSLLIYGNSPVDILLQNGWLIEKEIEKKK
jgi:hypothetical protein